MAAELDHLKVRDISKVPFGRNRFLALLGTSLTTLAMKAFVPRSASAQILSPYLCFGTALCDCCSNGVCCDTDCRPSVGCTGVTECWLACGPDTNYHLYSCCDFSYGVSPTTASCYCQKLVLRNACSPN